MAHLCRQIVQFPNRPARSNYLVCTTIAKSLKFKAQEAARFADNVLIFRTYPLPENPRVGGSIPPLGTTNTNAFDPSPEKQISEWGPYGVRESFATWSRIGEKSDPWVGFERLPMGDIYCAQRWEE